MLKIKDNVDLKELEKYGFIKVRKGMTTFVPKVKYWYTLCDSEYDCITIFKDRHIFFGLDCYGETYNVIYDLIKDDLVEKVKE
jgi:hypothetical protein